MQDLAGNLAQRSTVHSRPSPGSMAAKKLKNSSIRLAGVARAPIGAA
jgi:hypothetical protein